MAKKTKKNSAPVASTVDTVSVVETVETPVVENVENLVESVSVETDEVSENPNVLEENVMENVVSFSEMSKTQMYMYDLAAQFIGNKDDVFMSQEGDICVIKTLNEQGHKVTVECDFCQDYMFRIRNVDSGLKFECQITSNTPNAVAHFRRKVETMAQKAVEKTRRNDRFKDLRVAARQMSGDDVEITDFEDHIQFEYEGCTAHLFLNQELDLTHDGTNEVGQLEISRIPLTNGALDHFKRVAYKIFRLGEKGMERLLSNG